MGFFSWITSDTERSIANVYSPRRTFPVYVLIPEHCGGGYIEERSYEGYGDFGGHDIYDLVADWNRTNLTVDAIIKPERERWESGAEGDKWFEAAVKRWENACARLKDFADGKDEEYMIATYGKEYKRLIGIDIACYNEQNAALEYPIKIVEDKNLDYEDAEPSMSCPDQGFFYDDGEDEDYDDEW